MHIAPGKTAAGFCVTSAFWMTMGTLMGFLGAAELMAPDLFGSYGWITFGRIRPLHINLVLFGFVTPGLLGAAFYYLPRLLKTGLFSEILGIITVAVWNIALGGMVVTLMLGDT
ncbi:MAG: cbb3-type cytochrome c oxidase subunit I, partial [Thermodesulfobacteriota bacterium]